MGEGEKQLSGKEEEEEGASPLEHSYRSHFSKETLVCIRYTVCALPACQPGPTHLSGPLPRPQRGFWGYSCRTTPIPSLFSPLVREEEELGWRTAVEAVLFSFGYILKAKVSWTYSQHGQGGEGRGAMAGVGEGGGPPQPLHPKEHMSTWGGSPSVSRLPPPTAPNKRRSPSPKGYSPPQPGLYIQWFSAVLWLRGPRGGGGGPPILESQLDSGSDLGLWSIPGPTVCAICFF